MVNIIRIVSSTTVVALFVTLIIVSSSNETFNLTEMVYGQSSNTTTKNNTSNDSTPPVLLIHGYMADASVWNKWVELLKKDGISAYPITFKQSDDKCGSAAEHAKELSKIIGQIKDETGQNKVNIVGHSKGGLDARVYLANNTKDVANLVMIGTPNRDASVLTPSSATTPRYSLSEFGTLGLLYPGRVVLGVGSGEALNEVAVGLRDWPDFKERFARLREAVRLMPRSGRTSGSPSRATLPHRRLHHLRPTRGRRTHLRRRRRAGDGQVRRPRRRRLHLHQRQGHGPLHRQAAPGRRRRSLGGPAAGRRDRPDDRDQAVLRADPRRGAREHPLLGAALTPRRGQEPPRRPARDGVRRRQAAHRGGRRPLDRRDHPRGRGRGRASLRRGRLRPPGLPRPRRRPAGLPDVVRARRAAAAASALTNRAHGRVRRALSFDCS